MKLFALLLLILPLQSSAQNTQDVADQTFKLNGKTQYVYAFAEGDVLDLMVQELTGKELKSIEFLQFPDHMIFRAYELDSVLTKSLVIPQTGIYLIRFQEVGMSKKVCRFTLHRTPASMETARFNTTVPWDIDEYPDFQVIKKVCNRVLKPKWFPSVDRLLFLLKNSI